MREETLAKIFYWLLPFYLLSFVASTAGEEIFGWAIFLIFLIDVTFDLKKNGFKNTLKNLKIGADLPVLFFGFWALLATFIIFKNLDEVETTFRSIRWILLLYGFSYLLKKYFTLQIEKYLKFMFIATIIVGLYGVFQMFTRIDLIRSNNEHISIIGNFYRATGFFKVPLTYAYCLGMAGMFGLTAFIIRLKEKKNYVLPLVTAVATVAGIIASSTRGAWIAFFVAVIIITFLVDKKKAAVTFLISILVCGGMLLEPSIRDRITSIFNVTTETSNTQRISLWRTHLEMFKDHPILGVGYERAKPLLAEYYQKLNITDGFYGHAHNDFLNTLSGVGIFGAIAFVWFSLYFLILGFKTFKRSSTDQTKILSLGALGAQIYCFIGGITQCNFYDNEVNHILIFTWAILVAIRPYQNIFSESSLTKK